jgi:DNA-binding NarL/FixJ family response regulator
MTIRVLLADDHSVLRDGLAALRLLVPATDRHQSMMDIRP